MYSVDRENFALPAYPCIFRGALTACSSDEFSFKAFLGTLGKGAPAAFHKENGVDCVGRIQFTLEACMVSSLEHWSR